MNEVDDKLAKFLQECLGMSDAPLRKAYESDSDWTLIIKLHAYIEASLNFLIVKHFADPRLEDIIARLDISDPRRGKLAFVADLELLPVQYQHFIRWFSERRNKLVHDIKNSEFDLKGYIASLDPKQTKALCIFLAPILKEQLGFLCPDEAHAVRLLKTEPRSAIAICSVALMFRVYEKKQIRRLLS